MTLTHLADVLLDECFFRMWCLPEQIKFGDAHTAAPVSHRNWTETASSYYDAGNEKAYIQDYHDVFTVNLQTHC